MIDKLRSFFTNSNQKEQSMTEATIQTQQTCRLIEGGVEHLSATSACCEGAVASCQENVRQLAYSLWEKAGSPEGDGVDFWVEAEQLIGRLNSTT